MAKKTCLRFSRKELAAALAGEKRPQMRRRLLALRSVLDGHSHRQAARMAKVSHGSVGPWVAKAREGGLKALLAKPQRVSRPRLLDPKLVALRRSEIATALRNTLTSRQRARLRALDAFLADQPREAAARIAGIETDTLNGWIRILLSQGIEAVTRKPTPRRSRTDPVSIPVTQVEITNALANEQRAHIRKRLVALRAVLHGDTHGEAAEAAGAGYDSIARWLKRARAGGLAAVLAGRPPKKPMEPELVAAARAEISAALNRNPHWRLRDRLKAIDAALAGEPPEKAAALIHVKSRTLKIWLGQIRKHGIAPLLAKWQPTYQPEHPKLNADAATLHAHAANEKYPYIRKRLLALAYLAEGFSIDDTAVRARVSTSTVCASLRRFQQGGLAAISGKRSGRSPKLGPNELQAVAAMARAMPPEKLCAHIQAEFGIRYTPGGLKNMLKKQLGIVYAQTTSRAKPSANRQSRKKLGEDLNLAKPRAAAADAKNPHMRRRKLNATQLQELRDDVLERSEMSYGKLRDLVWARFQVRYSHAGLKRLLKREFGIVWTGPSRKLGEGLNLAALQVAMADAIDWRMKDRLKALIELAQGGQAETVAHSNGVHLETLRKWVKQYRRSGIKGLRGTRPERDGRPPKLSPEQRDTLTEWIVAQPTIHEAELCAQVKARFGVSYSPACMRRFAHAVRSLPSQPNA